MNRRFSVPVGVLKGKSVPSVGFPPKCRVPEPVDIEDRDVSLTQYQNRCFINDYSRRASNAVPEMRRVRPRFTCTS